MKHDKTIIGGGAALKIWSFYLPLLENIANRQNIDALILAHWLDVGSGKSYGTYGLLELFVRILRLPPELIENITQFLYNDGGRPKLYLTLQ